MQKLLFLSLFFMSPLLISSELTQLEAQDLITGKRLKLIKEQTQKTVLVFLSAKCPCSNSHIVEIKNLQKDFPEFSFVGVHSNLEEDLMESRKYFQSLNLSFPMLQDEKQIIANYFKANKTPHAFVLSEKGEIVFRGGVSSSQHFTAQAEHLYLREAIEDIKNKNKIRTPVARALGCSIKRRR